MLSKMKKENSEISLSTLAPTKGSTHRRKRIGLGDGSGTGKTAGRGQKGQTSRSGYSAKRGFEGGQMPLQRRLPKFGFTSRKKTLGVNQFCVVSLDKIVGAGIDGDITPEKLWQAGLVSSRRSKIKVLAGIKELSKVSIQAHAFSSTAKAAIEKSGGQATVV
jgi:large subunit ribosomal protein L15